MFKRDCPNIDIVSGVLHYIPRSRGGCGEGISSGNPWSGGNVRRAGARQQNYPDGIRESEHHTVDFADSVSPAIEATLLAKQTEWMSTTRRGERVDFSLVWT